MIDQNFRPFLAGNFDPYTRVWSFVSTTSALIRSFRLSITDTTLCLVECDLGGTACREAHCIFAQGLNRDVVSDSDTDRVQNESGNTAHEGITLTVDGATDHAAHLSDSVKIQETARVNVVDLSNKSHVGYRVDYKVTAQMSTDSAQDDRRQ
jgi:hypothetical protein